MEMQKASVIENNANSSVELTDEMAIVVNAIKQSEPQIIIKGLLSAVGKWLWLEFKEKPEEKVLTTIKSLGFKWNRKRRVWQCSCGVYSRQSPDDPREKYGQFKFA